MNTVFPTQFWDQLLDRAPPRLPHDIRDKEKFHWDTLIRRPVGASRFLIRSGVDTLSSRSALRMGHGFLKDFVRDFFTIPSWAHFQ